MSVAVGRALRETGQAIDRVGSSLMGQYAFKEELSRHRRVMPIGDLRPSVGNAAFVAPNASVIGDVRVESGAAIYYGAVLRGDRSAISIGEGSTIGDRVVVHTTATRPVQVGKRVTVGQSSTLHGCVIGDDVVVGIGSLVLGNVQTKAIVEPGSLVLENQTVKSGEVWGGSPAKFVRALTPEEAQGFASLAAKNAELAQKHHSEHERSEAQRQHLRDLAEFNTDARKNEYKEIPF